MIPLALANAGALFCLMPDKPLAVVFGESINASVGPLRARAVFVLWPTQETAVNQKLLWLTQPRILPGHRDILEIASHAYVCAVAVAEL